MNYNFIPFNDYDNTAILLFLICFLMLSFFNYKTYKSFWGYLYSLIISIILTPSLVKLFIYILIFKSIIPIVIVAVIIIFMFIIIKVIIKKPYKSFGSSLLNIVLYILLFISSIMLLSTWIFFPEFYSSIEGSKDTLYIVYNQKDLIENVKTKSIVEYIDPSKSKEVIYYVIGKDIPDSININIDISNNQSIEISIKLNNIDPIYITRISYVRSRIYDYDARSRIRRKIRTESKIKISRYKTTTNARIINKDGTIAKVIYQDTKQIHEMDMSETQSKLDTIKEILNCAIHEALNQ